jgi:hypothetical protein
LIRRHRLRFAALIVAGALALVACGSNDNGGVIDGPQSTSPNATQGP